MKNDKDADDIILPKKAGAKPGKSKKPMSPVLQVMKAVTDSALNPKRKKAPKKDLPAGPSKANQSSPKQRIEKNDGPSAEEKGEA